MHLPKHLPYHSKVKTDIGYRVNKYSSYPSLDLKIYLLPQYTRLCKALYN